MFGYSSLFLATRLQLQMLVSYVLQLSFILSALALGIFIPLDVDPAPGACSGWKPVISSISTNSKLPFFTVINPNDGPGDNGSQPSTAYSQCIPSLRPRSNTIVLGYINTGSKSLSNVQAEIDTYAGWSISYRPTGIFFDAAPTGPSLFDQYKAYATHARGTGFNFIGLDPGEVPDPQYFSIADLINVYESSYASFNAGVGVLDNPTTPISKQSVWLTNAPATGSYSEVVSQIVKKGFGAAYISDLSDDESGIPKQWSSFVGDVDKANAALGNSSSIETNITTDSPPNPTIGSSTGASDSPQATGRGPQQVSDHPPIGAIVGGSLGGLATISVSSFIVIYICRIRRRQKRYVTEEEAAHPFADPNPTHLENSILILGGKRICIGVPGNLQLGASSKQENNSTATTSQRVPSSYVGEGMSSARIDLVINSSTSGESPSIRRLSTGPPPTYFP